MDILKVEIEKKKRQLQKHNDIMVRNNTVIQMEVYIHQRYRAVTCFRCSPIFAQYSHQFFKSLEEALAQIKTGVYTGPVFFSCHVIIQMKNKHRKLFPNLSHNQSKKKKKTFRHCSHCHLIAHRFKYRGCQYRIDICFRDHGIILFLASATLGYYTSSEYPACGLTLP